MASYFYFHSLALLEKKHILVVECYALSISHFSEKSNVLVTFWV